MKKCKNSTNYWDKLKNCNQLKRHKLNKLELLTNYGIKEKIRLLKSEKVIEIDP